MIETNNRSPIFIVGYPRSGTTLVASLLDRHPDVAVPGETSFFLKHVPAKISNSLETKSARDLALIEEICNNFGVDTPFFENLFALDYAVGVKKLFEKLSEHFLWTHGKSVFAEKSPGHYHEIEEIRKYFKNSKIIFVYRDGRDAAVSLGKTNFGSNVPWMVSCLRWNRCVDIMTSCVEKDPSLHYMLRYEDLLSAPEDHVHSLCDFLEIEYSERQLDFTIPTSVIEPGVTHKENVMKPIDIAHAYKWKRLKTKSSMISAMTFVMRKRLAKLGYEIEPAINLSLPNRAKIVGDMVLGNLKRLALRLRSLGLKNL